MGRLDQQIQSPTLSRPRRDEIGDLSWVERNTFLNQPNQVWNGPEFAVAEAGQGEATQVGSRNSIRLNFIYSLVQVHRMPSSSLVLACRRMLTQPE